MAEYREITSSLEGRLLILKSKTRGPSRTKPTDFFLSRPTQTYSVVLRAAAPRLLDNVSTAESILNADNLSPPLTRTKTNNPANHDPTPPVDSSKSVKASIELAEPALYVQGYDKIHAEAHPSTVLRGSIHITVAAGHNSKPVSLQLKGLAQTEWPESWRLRNVSKIEDSEFLNHEQYLLRDGNRPSLGPGTYIFDFEIPISSMLPETIDAPVGRVWYELSAVHGGTPISRQRVRLIRMNCPCLLESAEPWCVIGRQDWIRYCFIFYGNSFKIGGPLPMNIRLSHMGDVTWHYIEIRLIEDMSYTSRDGRAIRVQSRDKGVLAKQAIANVVRASSRADVESIAATAKSMPVDNVAVWPLGMKSLTANSVDVGNQSTEEVVVMDEKFDLILPPCGHAATNKTMHTIHHATTYSCIDVRHYLKIIVNVSRPLSRERDMTYELVVRIPIHVLSCGVRDTDTMLPAYRQGCDDVADTAMRACSCAGPGVRHGSADAFDGSRYWTSSAPILNQTNLPAYDE